MKPNTKHPADIIVDVMNRLYSRRLTTTSGGNLSIMDDQENMWISPGGIDKGNLQRRDIMCIKPDGSIIGIVPYALPGSEKLGKAIYNEFIKGFDTVVLENHGVVIGAKSLDMAFAMFEARDFTARTGINASMLRYPLKSRTGVIEDVELRKENVSSGCCTDEELTQRSQLCIFSPRCYEHELFTCLGGAFATRLSDGGLLMTPHGEDLMRLEPDDIVYIKNGSYEGNNIPLEYAHIAQQILSKHDDIDTVGFTFAPHIMSFACTDAPFDSRLIPESYVCLKYVPRFSQIEFEQSPECVINALIIKKTHCNYRELICYCVRNLASQYI